MPCHHVPEEKENYANERKYQDRSTNQDASKLALHTLIHGVEIDADRKVTERTRCCLSVT